jgi:hypothetical protein
MAEVVDEMPEPRPDCLPWDVLLDGRRWKLAVGDDYDSGEETRVVNRAKAAARARGRKVETRVSRRQGAIWLRAVDRDGNPLPTPSLPAPLRGQADSAS